ncbi:MAG: sulfite exporter TauE/SafE family protein [Silicimonas sp.]|nr:sulfite exporter TauE/SafE family protein [Silicimonas sp.]
MTDALTLAMHIPGLPWLVVISLGAGLIYGFAGFGAALVYMPLSTVFLSPPLAVATMSVTAIGSIFTVLPQAWAAANHRAALTMLAAALVCTPFGLWALQIVDPQVIRWTVSTLVVATLVLLISGWRYQTTPGPKSWTAVGSGVGLMGGATGLNGPILILFQLAGKDNMAQVRANSIVVLTLSGLSFMPILLAQGALPKGAIALGMLLLIPYGLGGYLGRKLFRPEIGHIYRRIAYAVIAGSAILGLPLWD